MSRHNGTIAPPSVPRAQEKAFTQHQVARLLQWLATGADAQGHDASLEHMRRNALWLGFLMIPSTADDKTACAHQMGQWLPRLPDAIREPGKGFAPCASKPNGVSSLTGWWPLSMTKGDIPTEGWTSPGVVALDVAAAESETELHLAWRRWLQLFNAMQCLPGMLLVTTNGLDGHDYDALAIDGSSHGGAPAQVAYQAALHQAWSEVLGQVLSELKAGLTKLAHAGAPTPEVGLELADERGRVLADAEMAWPHAKVAVLRPDQEDMTQSWLDAGWKVMLLDESLTMVSGQAWPLVIAPLLGLELKNEE
jgi:DEAD/DEAH box helicase domain-containing protein